MQALEALRKLKTEKVQETKELKLKLEHVRTHKVNADQLKKVGICGCAVSLQVQAARSLVHVDGLC